MCMQGNGFIGILWCDVHMHFKPQVFEYLLFFQRIPQLHNNALD